MRSVLLTQKRSKERGAVYITELLENKLLHRFRKIYDETYCWFITQLSSDNYNINRVIKQLCLEVHQVICKFYHLLEDAKLILSDSFPPSERFQGCPRGCAEECCRGDAGPHTRLLPQAPLWQQEDLRQRARGGLCNRSCER